MTKITWQDKQGNTQDKITPKKWRGLHASRVCANVWERERDHDQKTRQVILLFSMKSIFPLYSVTGRLAWWSSSHGLCKLHPTVVALQPVVCLPCAFSLSLSIFYPYLTLCFASLNLQCHTSSPQHLQGVYTYMGIGIFLKWIHLKPRDVLKESRWYVSPLFAESRRYVSPPLCSASYLCHELP